MSMTCRVQNIIQSDPLRWHILGAVRSLRLPDCWVAAGFVRNAVWDHLHQRFPSQLHSDVDVIWHDPQQADPAVDRRHEAALQTIEPALCWSVKNQARLHVRNGDAPYMSAIDAMRYWPETATAVAVRRNDQDECEVIAPFGLNDLVALTLRPTPRFVREKRHIYEARLQEKQWAVIWPLLSPTET